MYQKLRSPEKKKEFLESVDVHFSNSKASRGLYNTDREVQLMVKTKMGQIEDGLLLKIRPIPAIIEQNLHYYEPADKMVNILLPSMYCYSKASRVWNPCIDINYKKASIHWLNDNQVLL